MAYDRPDKKAETWISIILIVLVVIMTTFILTRALPKRGENVRTQQAAYHVNH